MWGFGVALVGLIFLRNVHDAIGLKKKLIMAGLAVGASQGSYEIMIQLSITASNNGFLNKSTAFYAISNNLYILFVPIYSLCYTWRLIRYLRC